MKVIYQGVDITESVRVKECCCVDASRDRVDSLEISFENPQAWHRWEPKVDDTIEVMEGSYTTGKMYVCSVLPDDHYRIFAISVPQKMKERRWESFEGMTLKELFQHFADMSGMGCALFGIDEHIRVPYIVRENETGTAFLSRVMRLEGGLLKCVNGRLIGMGIAWAQSLKASQTMRLNAGDSGITYRLHSDLELASMTVHTPWAENTAYDKDCFSKDRKIVSEYPAIDKEAAGRWARGMLLNQNRLVEEIEISAAFNPGWTAAGRMDIESSTVMNGQWMVDEVRHDFINRTSTMIMLRCRTGVA